MARATIIAEVGLAHDGSFAMAKSYVEAFAEAGADIIKFQFHMPHESSPEEPFRARVLLGDQTRQAYWERTGFLMDQWRDLINLCTMKHVGFMASTFTEDAVTWLRTVGAKQWKVPSGQHVNVPMLLAIAERHEPVYIATGLSDEEELEHTLSYFPDAGVTLLHTTTQYPTLPEYWRLGQLDRLARRFLRPVGLSDHSGSIACGLAAAARCSTLAALEVHVTLSKHLQLPDTLASLELPDFKRLVQGVREIEASRTPAGDEMDLRRKARATYMPTLIAKAPISKGEKIQLTHLIFQKKGAATGLGWEKVVGHVATRDIQAGESFASSDVVLPACAPSA